MVTRSVSRALISLFVVGLWLENCQAEGQMIMQAAGRFQQTYGGEETLALLQISASGHRMGRGSVSAENLSPAERLTNAKPLYWLHVPKCSSVFLNLLTQHPGICPGANITNTFPDVAGDAIGKFHRGINLTQACPGAFAHFGKEHRNSSMLGRHRGIGTFYNEVGLKGHLVTTMREPKSRLISAYNFGMHSWPLDRTNVSLRHYVEVMRGHALKMLVRDRYQHIEFHVPVPTSEEIQEAHRRLRDGFAFIGILEEWPLSVCLFHKMFGGQCSEPEFRTIHKMRGNEHKELVDVQEKELHDFEDPYDGPLYELALRLFHQNLKEFNVSKDTCQECWEAARSVAVLHNE